MLRAGTCAFICLPIEDTMSKFASFFFFRIPPGLEFVIILFDPPLSKQPLNYLRAHTPFCDIAHEIVFGLCAAELHVCWVVR